MMTSSNGNIFRVTGPLCGELTDPGEFPTQRPVTRSFDVFFDLRLNKRLSKQPWGWWLETPSWSLWRQCNGCRQWCDATLYMGCSWVVVLAICQLFALGNILRRQWCESLVYGDINCSVTPWWRHQMEKFSALLTFCVHKGQWRGALMSSLICAWINGWVNNREAGDLRRHRAHFDVIVIQDSFYQCYMIYNKYICSDRILFPYLGLKKTFAIDSRPHRL